MRTRTQSLPSDIRLDGQDSARPRRHFRGAHLVTDPCWTVASALATIQTVRLSQVPAAAGTVVLSACSGSSTPAATPDALTAQVAHMCSVNASDLTYYGDVGSFAGPNYTWTLQDGSKLVIYQLVGQPYRVSCPNGRHIRLPSFDPSTLPTGAR